MTTPPGAPAAERDLAARTATTGAMASPAARVAGPGESLAFAGSLAAVTVAPMLVLAAIHALLGRFDFAPWLPGGLAIAFITGPMHVASTAFFYLDRSFRPVLSESPTRCFWSLGLVPAAVTGVGIAGGFWVGAWAFLAVFAFHSTWLFYHYQRQNFGLASFVSTNVGAGRLPRSVNTAFNLAAMGAIACLMGLPDFVGMMGGESPLMQTRDLLGAEIGLWLRRGGIALYGLASLLLLQVLWSEPRLRSSPRLVAALVLGLVFFLPAVVSDVAWLAFMPLAVAHGAQYLIMMSVVSGRSSRGWLGLVAMIVVGAGAGFALDSLQAWPAVLIGLGLIQVHFLVDAKVWRLREPRQRALMNERFDFLLAP